MITVSWSGLDEQRLKVIVPRLNIHSPEIGTFLPNGTFTCGLQVDNNDTSPGMATLLVAIYKNNTLVDVDFQTDNNIVSKKYFELNFDLPDNVSDYSACIMLLSSMEELLPLSEYWLYP